MYWNIGRDSAVDGERGDSCRYNDNKKATFAEGVIEVNE